MLASGVLHIIHSCTSKTWNI